jgi:hypothetical protein
MSAFVGCSRGVVVKNIAVIKSYMPEWIGLIGKKGEAINVAVMGLRCRYENVNDR